MRLDKFQKILVRMLEVVSGEQLPPRPIPCKRCGRALTSASSIEAGMGHVCRGKTLKRDTATIDMFETSNVGTENI